MLDVNYLNNQMYLFMKVQVKNRVVRHFLTHKIVYYTGRMKLMVYDINVTKL